jgi:tRNA A-37 threonylcarbamoyl transferase component Bud32
MKMYSSNSAEHPYKRSVSSSLSGSSQVSTESNMSNDILSPPVSMNAHRTLEKALPGLLERLHGEPMARGMHGVVWKIPRDHLQRLWSFMSEIQYGLRKFPRATDVMVGPDLSHRRRITGDVALKIQFSGVLVDGVFDAKVYNHDRAMWRREVRTMMDLPNGLAPRVYKAMTTGYIHFLAMELVEGTPIDTVIKFPSLYGFRSSPKTMVFLEKQVQTALWALWKRGHVHLDLHGNNILVRPNGTIVIIDFGDAASIPRSMRPKGLRMPWWDARTHWKTRIEKDSDKFVAGLHREGYNPNARIITVLRKRQEELRKRGKK